MTLRLRQLVAACAFAAFASPSLSMVPCDAGSVRIISPHGSGVSDLMARVLAAELSVRMGKSFYVEPVIGAGGAIGMRALAEAAPDGCTLGIVGLSTLVIAPEVEDNVGYDPQADFSPVAMIGGSPAMFAVKADLGITSFAGLIEAMKSNGLVPTVSTPGRTTITAILPATIFDREGIEAVIVPFKDSSEALIAAAQGDVDAVSLSYSTMRPQIEAGALVPLYVSAPQRLPELPNVPTLAEIGQTDLETLIWFGLAGPDGMDPEMASELNTEVNAILQDSDAAKPLLSANVSLMLMSPEEMSGMISRQTAAYAPAIKKLGQK